MIIRDYQYSDLPAATALWNAVVEAGESFPQEEPLTGQEAHDFFCSQTATVLALDGDRVEGLYILHPNNVGRCAHIANASYCVREDVRGRGVGRALVNDCLRRAKAEGFRALQFNAVVCDNAPAVALYTRLGFATLARVQGGFRKKGGDFADTFIMLKEL